MEANDLLLWFFFINMGSSLFIIVAIIVYTKFKLKALSQDLDKLNNNISLVKELDDLLEKKINTQKEIDDM